MIGTVVKISLLRLWNTKSELALIFIVPVLFFSIFALIFSRGVGRKPGQIRVSIVCDDESQPGKLLAQALSEREELRTVTGIGSTAEGWPIGRLSKTVISRHGAEVVVYIPPTFTEHTRNGGKPEVQILHEGTNPISAQIIEAALAQTMITQQVDLLAAIANPQLDQTGAGSLQDFRQTPPVQFASGSNTLAGSVQLATAASGLPNGQPLPTFQFEKENIFASNKHNPKIAMYAAGIAVMFLLFSASGAGASLLEEKEAGTLDRLLSSHLTLTDLLIGKWLYMAGLGFVQITTMFVWGQLVFDVDLWGHLPGFFAMAGATTCASASFALLLATLCRSRQQLNGVALVLVLGMSALGGSMIPRYIMSESMQQMGRFTFNGWAIDGFKKIFWYDLPLSAIQTEIGVLLFITVLFGTLANMLVRRWSLS